MAKLKPASGKKKKGGAKSFLNAIPCLLLILMGFTFIILLFYLVLRSGA